MQEQRLSREFSCAILWLLLSPLSAAADDVASGNSSFATPREHPVRQHTLTESGDLIAVDLLHGRADQSFRVERTWGGPEVGNGHFGPGWYDSNVIHLKHESEDLITVTRGPVVWITAVRGDGNGYSSRNGDLIREEDQQWVLTRKSNARLTFDKQGNLLQWQPGDNAVATFTWSIVGSLKEIRLGKNNVVTYKYQDDHVSAIEGPEGARVRYFYDDEDRLVRVRNSWQHEIRYLYTEDGNLAATLDQFGNVLPVPPVSAPTMDEQFADEQASESRNSDEQRVAKESNDEFDPVQLESILPTDPSHASAYLPQILEEHDAALILDRLLEAAVGSQEDEFGRIVAIELPDRITVTVAWDSLDQPVRIEWSDGNWISFERNAHGDLVSFVSANGEKSTYGYDYRGRIGSTQHGSWSKRDFKYDDRDCITSIQFADGRAVNFTYDFFGRHSRTEWSTGAFAAFVYDREGKLIEKFVNGLPTSYEYDDRGRLTSLSDPIHGDRQIQSADSDAEPTQIFWGEAIWSIHGSSPNQPFEATLSAGNVQRKIRQIPDDAGEVREVITTSGRVWSYLRDDAGQLSRIE